MKFKFWSFEKNIKNGFLKSSTKLLFKRPYFYVSILGGWQNVVVNVCKKKKKKASLVAAMSPVFSPL